MSVPKVDIREIGQLVVSVIVLALVGLGLALHVAQEYLTALFTLASGIVAFWFAGQISVSGTKASNGTIDALMARLDKLSDTNAASMPVSAVQSVATAMRGPENAKP